MNNTSKGVRQMTEFFSRFAESAVVLALAAAILYAVGTIGPIALDRWF